MLISKATLVAQSDLKGNNTKTVNPPKTASPDTSARNKEQTALPPKDVKTVDLDTLDTDDGDDEQALDKKVTYNARDSIRYETKGQKVYLFGDAFIEYESMSIKAEYITVDNEKNTIKSTGKKDSLGRYIGSPVFKIDGQESGADSMIYNVKTKKGKIYGIKTKEGELILMGSEVKKDSNDVVYMKDLKCIPCQFEDSRTIFRAKKAKIIPDDKIVTGPMYLEIGGVPTPLGLPFGYFPNTKKRHSGILIPTFNSSEVLGYNLKDGGFYWGISDQTDMTIRGDIYTNGSWALRTLNNYNINYKYTGSLSLGYSEFRSGEREIPQSTGLATAFGKQKDFSVTWTHTQDQKNNPSVRFSSNVNIKTSKYNKYNALNTGQYLANTFYSSINYTKTFKLSSLSVGARHDQNTQTKIMNLSFPELTFNVNRFFPFKKEGRVKQNPLDKLGISYLLEARNTLTDYDSAIFKGDIGDKLKYGVRHSIPISTNITVLKYFTLTPALNLNATMTTKTTEKYFIPDSNKVYTNTVKEFKTGYDANFNTALTTKVFMDYLFRSKRVKQIRHLLIPTVNYLYRPDYGADQFGFYKQVRNNKLSSYEARYSIFENAMFPGPPDGEQNNIGLNLNNTIDAKIRQNTDTGYTYNKVQLLQNLTLNGNYNFAAQNFKMSLISISARTKVWKFFDLLVNSNFDPYAIDPDTKLRVDKFAFSVSDKLVRFTNGNAAINASFSSNVIQAMKPKKPDLTNGAEKGATPTNTVQSQEQLPWNLNMYYNVGFTKDTVKVRTIQTLSFSGDIALTKNWKVGVTSGYDFTAKNLSYTSINIYRDLRCWEARIDWVPFGFRKSYSLTINLKTSMLSDVKIPRQRQWYDNM